MTKQITILGVKVSYDVWQSTSKSGATIILLHGWSGTKESWGVNAPAMSEHFECIALDLPGFGKSQEPNRPWGTFEYAEFLREFAKTLQIQLPVIVGKSFGGRIAIVYASKWPQELHKLVLVSSAGIEEKTDWLKVRIGIVRLLGLGPLKQVVYKLLRLKEKDRYKREVKKIVTNQDLRSLLPDIQAETLIIWGSDDQVLSLSIGKQLAAGIKNSRFEVITGGDHWVHQKRAEEFNQLVIKFL